MSNNVPIGIDDIPIGTAAPAYAPKQAVTAGDMARKIEFDDALEQALTLFWDHGYRGTSMGMLTSALGVEKPSIYASFGCNHQLYLAALARYRVWLIDTVRGILDAEPTARGGIDRAITSMMSRGARKSRMGCFATNSTLELADHDPLVLRETRAIFNELHAVFAEALKRAQHDGQVRDDLSAEILAQLLVNAIEGARVMEKTRASANALSAIVPLILSLLDHR